MIQLIGTFNPKSINLGLYFHIFGEGVVRISSKGRVVGTEKEHYIDFRMRLLGDDSVRSGNTLYNIK